jgi:hypothetical protein
MRMNTRSEQTRVLIIDATGGDRVSRHLISRNVDVRASLPDHEESQFRWASLGASA